MGEKIRDYAKIKIGEETFNIELNKPHVSGMPYCIHIQNHKFRMEMPDYEFARMASAIVFARQQFEKLKENSNE